jgi:hypothetical protein
MSKALVKLRTRFGVIIPKIQILVLYGILSKIISGTKLAVVYSLFSIALLYVKNKEEAIAVL